MQLGGRLENALNRAYKVVFVPYALIFILYVIFGIVVSAILAYGGIPIFAAVYLFMIFMLVGGLAFFCRWLVRLALMKSSRANSMNPTIKRIVETDTLRFLSDNYVEYAVQMELRAASANVQSMDFLLGWHGKRDDIVICDCYGCSITMHDPVDHTGLILRMSFPKSLPMDTNYPTGFTALLDNSRGHIKPFLRKPGPYLAQDKLTMTIILPEKKKGIFVERAHKNFGDKKPIKEKYVAAPNDTHTYTVIRPVQGLSYFVGISDYYT